LLIPFRGFTLARFHPLLPPFAGEAASVKRAGGGFFLHFAVGEP
jgi:hypothetical protein